MSQTTDTQPRGDTVAFLNRDKQAGDHRPAFEGHICKPGCKDKRPLALWTHEYTDPKTGEVKISMSGRVGKTVAETLTADMTPAQQLVALTSRTASAATALSSAEAITYGNLSIAPDQIVVFPNGFKDEAPEKERNDFWGLYNPGDGTPLARIAYWMKTDKNGRLYLSGATSYPQTDKGDVDVAEAAIDTLVAEGKVSRGMPKKKSSGGRGA